MTRTLKFPMYIDLQLFAEGAGDGGGTSGTEGTQGATGAVAMSQKTGVKNPLADVKYGIQPEEVAQTTDAQQATQTPTDNRQAEYDAFIKANKDLDDARVQNIVQKRLKNYKETVEQNEAARPILETLAKKYGVDASDLKALNKAIEEDDAYYEEEALEKGLTVQQLKDIRKMERENADLKRQMQEQSRQENANRLYSQWMQQADSTRAIYPSFDLNSEMQNPEFIKLLRSNVDVRTAYEVLHKDEIIYGAMQFTANTVKQKLTNKIIADGARPTENGNSSQGAAVVKSDVSKLTRADRDEIARKVARGEKITFG